MGRRALFVCVVALSVCLVNCLNGTECLGWLNNSTSPYYGQGVDNLGKQVERGVEATAIPYDFCVKTCDGGDTSESFSWSVFSKQFTSWLLPYLALISQLPWGAKYRLDNVVSMLLTVGSPMLAAYSLILTVLNGHYVNKRFSHISYPNKNNAVRILAGLQQSPVRVFNQDGLLASLIVLPKNDMWWARMKDRMNYEHTWSISAISSIGWVVIAYCFTVADSFSDIDATFHANGQGAGCLWLWLIPIVVGWLQISPKCDHARLTAALKESNEIAYVATTASVTPVLASSASSGTGSRRAFFFLMPKVSGKIFPDEYCSSPIFNYARLFSWTHVVEEVAEAFEHATEKAESKHPVHAGPEEWRYEDAIPSGNVRGHNRVGTLEEVIEYCAPDPHDFYQSRLPIGVMRRFMMAATTAFILQWFTTGGAIVVNANTPTTGLGCRTGSYMIYGVAATFVWAFMVASSFFAYISTNRLTLLYDPNNATPFQKFSATFSILLRRSGKILAALNAIWIITLCIFQFINFFNRCSCNSSVWSRGFIDSFMVVVLTDPDRDGIKKGWGGGVAMASVASILFMGFIQLYIDHDTPAHSDSD